MLKKILATALAAAMIFGLAATAFAASFSDVVGNKNEKAIIKLASVGLLNGYPDGSFQPLGNITRAEFAAVVVRALGYESSALLLTGAPAFNDCADAEWAWGYINVATAQGVVKGYPEGTFAPNANVTIAEAITMIVRALGRDDQAAGAWPTGHIMVASQLNMLPSDLPGVDVSATRAMVAQLVSNVLDKPFAHKNSDGVWVEDLDTSFLSRNSSTMLKAKKIVDYSTSSSTVTLQGETTTTKVSSNARFVGGTSVAAFKGQTVDLILDEDGYVVYIGGTSATSYTGVVTAIDKTNKTITLNGTVYTVLDSASVFYNGKEIVGDAVLKITDLKDATATIGLDSAGKVAYITATEANLTGKITSKTTTAGGTRRLSIDGEASVSLASDATIVRNGSDATFAQLQVGDDLLYSKNSSGSIDYIDAYAQKVTGVLQEKVTTDEHVTYKVNDVVYKAALNDDGDDDVTEDKDSVTGKTLIIPGVAVTLTLDRDGFVSLAKLQSVTTSEMLTLQSKRDSYTSAGDQLQTITLSDGTVLTLSTNTSGVVNTDITRNGYNPATFSDLTSGDLLFIHKTTTGRVDVIEAFSSVSGYVYREAAHSSDAPFYIITDSSELNEATLATVESVVAKIDPADATNIAGLAQLTRNGKLEIVTASTAFAAGAEVKISSWNLTDETGARTPALVLRDFTGTGHGVGAGKEGLVVKSIESDGTTTYLVLHDGTEATSDATPTKADNYLKLTSSTVIHRKDVKIAASDIVIGDKVQLVKSNDASATGAAADTAWTASYLVVTTDTTIPAFVTGQSPTSTATTRTVNFQVKEDVRVSYKIYAASGNLVYSSGTQEVARNTPAEIAWKDAITGNMIFDFGVSDADRNSSAYSMVLTIRDYAGNARDPISVNLKLN